MARVDKWPSTPMKLMLAWGMTLATFLLTGVLLWFNRPVNIEVYGGWLAFLAAYDGVTAYQFKAKRETAWEPPAEPTKSEAIKPPATGQPAVPAAPVTRPLTSAEAEEAE